MLEEINNCFSKVFEQNSFEVSIVHNNYQIRVDKNNIYKSAKLVKDNEKLKFNQIIVITAVDYPNNKNRFQIIYIFLSIENNARLIFKCNIEEEDVLESLVSLFPAANWYEREVWDLFGINFKNHPDLRRILTDYGFIGHPLRKDFPLSGNVEVKYDVVSKKVIYEPVKLTQSFRVFDFESPWVGEEEKNKNE